MEDNSGELVIKQEIKQEEEVCFEQIEDQSYSDDWVAEEDELINDIKQEECHTDSIDIQHYCIDGLNKEIEIRPEDLHVDELTESMNFKEKAIETKRHQRFSVVKLLELNKFYLVSTDELKPSETSSVSILNYDGKECHAIAVHSGEKNEMEISLQELVYYENIQSQYKLLSSVSKFVQTEDPKQTPETPSLPESLPEEFFTGAEKPSCKRRTQYCIFCEHAVSNLPRHVFAKHTHEDRVKEIQNVSDRLQSRLLMSKLRREGYVKQSAGRKFVYRKGAKSEYVSCPSCGVYFSETTMHRHFAKCTGKKPPKNLLSLIRDFKKLSDVKSNMSDALKHNIIPGMSTKECVVEAIVNDREIVEFGNSQCIKFCSQLDKRKNLIRSRLRAVAKVKLCVGAVDSEVKNLIDIFHRERWTSFVKGVQNYANLKANGLDKQSPTNVQQIGLLLRNIAKDIVVRCSLDEEKRGYIRAWIEMYDQEYKNSICWQYSKLVVKKKSKT